MQTGSLTGMASVGRMAGNQLKLMALSLRALDKDPLNKDVDSEAQATAAEGGRRRGAAEQGRQRFGGFTGSGPVQVKIEWDGLTKRARQVMVTSEMIADLTAAPRGSVIAFLAATPPSEDDARFVGLARYTVNLADGGAPSRVPSAPSSAAPTEGPRGRGGGGFGFRGGMVFTRDGRSLYFRSGRGIYVRPSAVAGRRSPRRMHPRLQAGAAVASARRRPKPPRPHPKGPPPGKLPLRFIRSWTIAPCARKSLPRAGA